MAETKTKNVKKSKKNAVQVPSKKTMNFVHHQSSFSLKKVLPIVLVIIIVGAVFAKFGFIDPLARKTAAYNELTVKQEQLAAINAKLAGYNDLAMEYGRYSYGWMNDTEVNMVSRMDVLNLVEQEISSKAYIDNMAVNNNVLTLNIHGITLEQASTMVKSLEESGLVSSAAVYNAVAEEAEEAKIFMSIILTKEAE
ncbi:MAG: hypothetical protein IJZ39_08270 [Oscillospiraceae bacterium]|nr:hypothetical protein [Oscillospiraceae bacterium]